MFLETVLKEPPPGEKVVIHTQNYMLVGVPGVDAEYDWAKEGSPSLPSYVYIDPTASTLIIEHYNPVNDAGIYVCDAYNDEHFFVAGRRFQLGKGKNEIS